MYIALYGGLALLHTQITNNTTTPTINTTTPQVKTQLQAMSRKEIAVGHQYAHRGMWHALCQTYGQHGVRGLWRGVEGAVPRLMVRVCVGR